MSSLGPAPAAVAADTDRVERFRRLLRVPTVSRLDADRIDWPVFDEFLALLPELYPAVHRALSVEVVADHSLLYRWPGRSPGRPTVLMAHYDVVPADGEGWRSPPFAAELEGAGALRDAVIVGRGTLDDKGALAAILEAVEELVTDGFKPEHDVYLSFGHDEEVAGIGASSIVEVLRSRGVRPDLVLDEGGAIVEPGLVRGVDRSLAVVGVTEKGITSVGLTVEQAGGHASTPPKLTATARLARAITRVTRSPFPARMSPAVVAFVKTIAPHARGAQRFLFGNLRLTRPLVTRLFAAMGDEPRAMVRTTAAVTELRGSDGANVLAERATAIVNVRVAVGSSVADAVAHLRKAIADPLVRIDVLHPSEPSPVSPSSGPQWAAIADAVAVIAPEAVVTPYTMLGASDSRHFTAISDAVYRFTPFRIFAAGRATLHARNESIPVAVWLDGITFYAALLRGR
ncbi:M20/M25/M40 family metallo-hydrolase [Naasia aerilata]|uniref:Peptidase M20 n=1 Tax=Naasia aerilata TaxID=1162966 RepID=A0ABN6XRK7_9MICO|nr:M20/M25/M40 family metallo-hydrolase [Naasia aerilata]BDZ47677.1 peptidase M20 [Naasia aerilata]